MRKNKGSLFFGIMVISLQLACPIQGWSNEAESSKASLGNYSIKFLPHALDTDATHAVDTDAMRWEAAAKETLEKTGGIICRAVPFPIPTTSFYQLTKPEQTNIVAILKIDRGACVLNPDGWGDYGPIPRLQNMTLSAADQLWGPADEHRKLKDVSDSEVGATYGLVYSNPHQLQHFYLDLVFRHNRLQRYRITSDLRPNSTFEWCELNKKKAGA